MTVKVLQQKLSEKQRKLFTGRGEYLKQISKAISKDSTAAVLGRSGLGSTTLLKYFAAKNNSFYIDIDKLSTTPEGFAVDLIGSICFCIKGGASITEYTGIDALKQLKLGKKSREIIDTVDNELQKIKPDQELLLTSAFTFAESLASENKETTFILDRFEEIMKLNKFSGIKDALKTFFNTVEKNKSAKFIVSSHAVAAMRSAMKGSKISTIYLAPLSEKETRSLFEKITGRIDERIAKELHKISGGLPLIITELADTYNENKTGDIQKDLTLLNSILLSQLSTRDSLSYFCCSRLFTDSLNRARGESLLKTILKVVSQNRPLRLTELARMIYRSGPVTKSLLERLVEVDLIEKDGNTFDFSNPVLKVWCRMHFSGIEFNELPDEKTLKEALLSGGLQ